MSSYPQANRTAQWFGDDYTSKSFVPNVVVVHSTEGRTWPGYDGGALAPNMTGKPDFVNKTILWRAHYEDEESSRALVNLAGGVETNTANALQLELIGTCDPVHRTSWDGDGVYLAGRDYLYLPAAPDWYLNALAELAAYYFKKHGIRLQSGLVWNSYPDSYGNDDDRMTFAEWMAFYGWCGHQHVPENAHGDPGNFPMQKVLDKAKALLAGTTTTTSPQEDDMAAVDVINYPLGLNPADGKTPITFGYSMEIARNYSFKGWAEVAKVNTRLDAISGALKVLADAHSADVTGDEILALVGAKVDEALVDLDAKVEAALADTELTFKVAPTV